VKSLVSLLSFLVAASTGCGGAIDVQGHRGARGSLPENTLVGFAKAVSLGVCTLEMDVGMTSDGVLVAHHDTSLNPDIARIDGAWISAPPPTVYELPFDALQTYDVGVLRPGSAYAKRFPDQEGIAHTRVPRLRDVIRRAETQSHNTMRYNIETKLDPTRPHATPQPEAFARALVDAVVSEGIAARATIQSFDWRTLVAVKRLAPEVETSCLTSESKEFDTLQRGKPGPSSWTADFDADDYPSVPRLVQGAGCKVWSPNLNEVSREDMLEARGLGVRVAVWTVNDAADIDRMIDIGVDSIISDFPDRVLAAMKRRGVTSACESR
jgi:glycerophosphoryl diester phosphodiesterase